MRREKRLRRRLRAVDWLLVLLVLGGVLLGGRYLYERRRAATPTVTVEYTVLVSVKENVLSDSASDWKALIPIGSKVLSSNGTANMGRVVAVTAQSRLVPSVQKEKLVFFEHPSEQELLIRIRADAVSRDGDCLRVQDIRVGVGMRGDYRMGGLFAGNAQIVALTVIDP